MVLNTGPTDCKARAVSHGGTGLGAHLLLPRGWVPVSLSKSFLQDDFDDRK